MPFNDASATTDRLLYSLGTKSPEQLRSIIETVVEEFRNELGKASVDGYPAPSRISRFEQLPADVKEAHAQLERIAGLARRARHKDPLIAIELDLTDKEHRRLFATYAPYSIRAFAMRRGEILDDMSAVIHAVDEGDGWIQVTHSELDRVHAVLRAAGVPDAFLTQLPARRSIFSRIRSRMIKKA